jgi:hypothetical protein
MHLTAVLPLMQWRVVQAKRKQPASMTKKPSPSTREGKRPMRYGGRFAVLDDDEEEAVSGSIRTTCICSFFCRKGQKAEPDGVRVCDGQMDELNQGVRKMPTPSKEGKAMTLDGGEGSASIEDIGMELAAEAEESRRPGQVSRSIRPSRWPPWYTKTELQCPPSAIIA